MLIVYHYGFVYSLYFCLQALNNIRCEFETDDGRLAIVTPDRYEEVYDILENHFIPDEPLCTSFGTPWDKAFKSVVDENLQQNLSVCMISKDTDEMMGIRLIGTMKRTDPPLEKTDDPISALFEFMGHKDKEVDIFNHLGVDEGIHFFTLGVHRKYRQRGLASRLLLAAVALSKELGFKGIKGEGTSNFSQRIYEKAGFETLATLPYDTYLTPAGHPIREKSGVHTCTKVYALKL